MNITVTDVRNYNSLPADVSDTIILQYLPIAQKYIDNRLNDSFSDTIHSDYISHYVASVARYTYYLIIDKISVFYASGIGQLKYDEVEKQYMTPEEIRTLKADVLKEVDGYVSIIINAIEEDEDGSTDIEDYDGAMNMGGAVFVSMGGNDTYKTDYGDGSVISGNDEELRDYSDNEDMDER